MVRTLWCSAVGGFCARLVAPDGHRFQPHDDFSSVPSRQISRASQLVPAFSRAIPLDHRISAVSRVGSLDYHVLAEDALDDEPKPQTARV